MLKKLLIAYDQFPPIAEDLKESFNKKGVQVEVFYTTDYWHWFYLRVIKFINRHARNLRFVPKDTDIFKAHPLNLANFVGSNFETRMAQSQPDAALVIHGLPFSENFISNITIPKIGWHLEPRVDLPYLIDNARPFDIYNSFSQKAADMLVGAGFDCRYLCHAVSANKFYPEEDAQKIYDVVFVGNWSPWREEVLMAAFEVTSNIALFGGYWKKRSSISRKTYNAIYKGEKIIGSELNRLFNSSKIVLNASRTPGSYGLNMRFFEVLASDSLLLTDPVPELERHFIPNVHLVEYKSVEELKCNLRLLLDDQQKRDSVRHAGMHLVLKNYNYDLMAENLLQQFHEISTNKSALTSTQNTI